MLPILLNVPRSAEDWTIWSFHHRLDHGEIRQAIMAQKSTNLSEYILDPINFQRADQFLQNNQQSHNEANSVLGLQGSDLQTVDFGNERQLAAWIAQHYQEHFDLRNVLHI